MKNLFIIAGPNGAGKTTSAFSLLSGYVAIDEYVNADAIASALSPFHSESMAIQAGRLMLTRIRELLKENKSFAFETTLASRSFVNLIHQAKKQGYETNVLFLWLDNLNLAIERVKARVSAGGHDIPLETIIRRYHHGIKNFFQLYASIVDKWSLFNNSNFNPELICEKIVNNSIEINQPEIWHYLSSKYSEGHA